ncbi:prolipoprotein diacylglyceryl transferase [Metabacillus idriensis]|uniref:prolipoprotein diacylglyceryl transferase n=1 Tax=Metabacillus idriensis TaxID=324768 RepID=UPI0008A8509D|nr:prolipoprotein diacylglyceryl transferase [Metabacillus idriensis]MCM3597951.1 prolipoprotein diacylglyceryl transferase [Metabacillus idriensis]OHR73575.1 prolipoprotein diacylglyceryl transferase [Bacillus sp. HMSC76G11]
MSEVTALDRVAFEFGSLTVYWYGIIIMAGALIGVILANREGTKQGMPKDTFTDFILIALPISLIFARLYYVLFNWEFYLDNPGKIIAIWQGGIAIHGAILGGTLVAIWYSRRKNIPFLKLADILAPSLILGQAIGRWGNFMNQEAHGGVVTRSFLENLYLPDFIINQMYIDGQYYHPTFLYESLWNFFIFGLLIFVRRKNLVQGEMFFSYLILYSVGRFFIEGMRTDSLLLFDIIRIAQLVSISLIIIGITMIIYRRKNIHLKSEGI